MLSLASWAAPPPLKPLWNPVASKVEFLNSKTASESNDVAIPKSEYTAKQSKVEDSKHKNVEQSYDDLMPF